MTIKFIKGTAGIGLGYSAGDTASHFSDVEANELIESGFAVEEIEKKSVVNPEIEEAVKEIVAEIPETEIIAEIPETEIVAEIPETEIVAENADEKKTEEIEEAIDFRNAKK